MSKSRMSELIALVVSAALATGCLAESEIQADSEAIEYGSVEEGLYGGWNFYQPAAAGPTCTNTQGTNYAMAALATATAMELGRWQTATDFESVRKCGYVYQWGCQDVVQLTQTGKAQCADGECPNVQTILDLQKKEAGDEVVLDGTPLKNDTFATRLVSNLMQQKSCNMQPDNHNDGNCPSEAHSLEFSSATAGTCAADFWFHATRPGSSEALDYPGQLKNQLLTFGGKQNPYLAFHAEGDEVSIDPGVNMVGGDPMSSGSCPVLKSSGKYSRSNISGKCCNYKSKNRKFKRSSFSRNYYLCK